MTNPLISELEHIRLKLTGQGDVHEQQADHDTAQRHYMAAMYVRQAIDKLREAK